MSLRDRNPQSASSFPAHGLALFRTIFSLVYTVFNALVRFYHAHPEHDRLQTVCLAIECLSSLLALEYTLHSAPERITPRQLLRLAKAARALTRLTGQTFDFTPWTSLTPAELDAISPLPTPNPLTEYRIRIPEIRMPPSGNGPIGLCQHPGATLANVIKKLVRILPPDFVSPSPEGTVPPWTVPVLSPSPSPSPSPSDLESQSQSQSRSQSQSIPSIPSIPSISPLVSQSPCLPVSLSSSPQVPPSSPSPSPHSALRIPHFSHPPP